MTLAELLIAAAITASLGGAIVLVMGPAQAVVRAEQDSADMEQRLRFAVDTLSRDLLSASDVLPYRIGAVAPDPPGSVFPDRATMVFVDPQTLAASTRTYYFKQATQQLMMYDGDRTDSPVLDQVSGLSFRYLGEPPASLVRVTITARPLWVPLQLPNAARTIEFDVAPRGIARGA
jgi:hypothetical protein